MTTRRRIQPRKAWAAMQKLLQNPNDTGQVFVIVDALSGNTVGRLARRFQRTETGARIVREERMLLDTLLDRDYLRSLPEGSLGRTYLELCERAGITADGLVAASAEAKRDAGLGDAAGRLVGARLRDMHDLWHVVAGYPTDVIGELAVLGFTIPQTRNPGIAFIVAVVLFRIGTQAPLLRRAVFEAFARGLRAEWLPPQDWEALLPLPLDEVRRRLAVGEAPRYEELRSHLAEQAGAARAASQAA